MWKLRVSGNSRLIFVIIFVLFLSLPTMAKYSGGTGEPNNPYQIATPEGLIALGNEPNDYDKYFILIDDIDLSGYVFDKAVIAQLKTPYDGIPFHGVFNGNGHSISNLYIESKYRCVGLFGNTKKAEITNLGLINATVSGGQNIGGLIGETADSIISNCYSNGFISGTQGVGGLIGFKSSGTIRKCYSTGTVFGGSSVGGLIGVHVTGTLIHCYSDTTVDGGSTLGGLVGYNIFGEITQCYSTGTITGHSYLGGLIGYNKNGSATQCYSVVTKNNNSSNQPNVGGMVGYSENNAITNSFWDIEISGLTTSAAGIGKTTNEMYDPNTFINAGWDFVGENQNGTTEVWQIPESGGYPELTFFNDYEPQQLNGTGTQDDPYLISDANELGAICHYDLAANYKLSDSIDLSRITWGTAIIPYFEGYFDGNNKTISNMFIEGTSYTGLLGYILPVGEVKNLGITDVNITSLGEYTGGLASYNYGTVSQCYVTGKLENEDYIGGLICYNEGNINNCYSNASVDSNNYAGGLLCTNAFTGSVDKCYSTGKVTSNQLFYTGSLISSIDYERRNLITNNFWDIEISNLSFRSRADGIKGKTTAEMQMESTFTNAGWDFVGETDNGLEDIWTICEGTNYPRFVWQIAAGDAVCPDGITIDDFEYFLNHWNETDCNSENGFCEGTDLDFSGVVDINDFEILMNNWLEGN